VHKRVSYLVCTEDAVTRNTQRVRKAAKFNVTVVSPAFVEDAVKSGTVPCAADYAVRKKVCVHGLMVNYSALTAACLVEIRTHNNRYQCPVF
jgi:hypothetical protein